MLFDSADVDHRHVRGPRGLQTQIRIFKSAALLWWHAQAAGGFEKNVGRGLAVRHIIGRHQVLEVLQQVHR